MREQIWISMLHADLNVEYWPLIAHRLSLKNKLVKIILALMSSGTVASWLIWLEYTALWQSLSAATALLSVAYPLLNYEKSIETCKDLVAKWAEVRQELEALWEEYESPQHHGNPDNRSIGLRLGEARRLSAVLEGECSGLPDKKYLKRRLQSKVVEERTFTIH